MGEGRSAGLDFFTAGCRPLKVQLMGQGSVWTSEEICGLLLRQLAYLRTYAHVCEHTRVHAHAHARTHSLAHPTKLRFRVHITRPAHCPHLGDWLPA